MSPVGNLAASSISNWNRTASHVSCSSWSASMPALRKKTRTREKKFKFEWTQLSLMITPVVWTWNLQQTAQIEIFSTASVWRASKCDEIGYSGPSLIGTPSRGAMRKCFFALRKCRSWETFTFINIISMYFSLSFNSLYNACGEQSVSEPRGFFFQNCASKSRFSIINERSLEI